MSVDKGAANRFIKNAISQVKTQRPPGEQGPSHIRFSEEGDIHVPVKVTSKMIARAQYEQELKDIGSEEESDLELIGEPEHPESSEEAANRVGESTNGKGKGKAVSTSMISQDGNKKRRRMAIDPFAGALHLRYELQSLEYFCRLRRRRQPI